ncbi:MAG: mechanosensitive ion channel family protein [Caldilinea sp.]|nr:mechanosensitive ion channel [Caldilineaceae bacterium]MCB9114048.1 mechanosensitive ion channel [Caldilineaceae bacterium]MCB9118463.1 mechanosensitive ion channel [Caldilineaceae bacterium]MCO5212037.1 mechanosensitive ion channel family protein [Caldilinea sp.]HRW46643.1 mechanosensitive ion channel [Caldilinea sp.]
MDLSVSLPEFIKPLDQGALLEIILIVGVAVAVVVISQHLLPWLAERLHGRNRLYVLATVPVVRLVALVVALWLIVPLVIEPSFENFVALLGALGIMLGFALKDYVSSLVAGIVALYEMPYRLGDWIEIDGAYGEVRRIGMRTVDIMTPDATTVSIPHLKMWTSAIYNGNDGSPLLMCVVNFFLQPDHDGRYVKQVLHDVALTSVYVRIDEPVIIVASELPWGTKYQLKAYPIDARDQFDFTTDLTLRGKEQLAQHGIAFAAAPAIADARVAL